MSIQPDSGYRKTRAELLNYELAAFAALRSGVPNCYRDGYDNTAWGWILRALARPIGDLDYMDQYALVSQDPAQLTPPDLLRQMVPFLPLGKDYPNSLQSDQEFRLMVLRLLAAYRHGARLPALAAIITAFTGAEEGTFSVTEMYTRIGQPGIDCSYRNTIQIEVPIGGSSSNLFSSTPNLIQDIYNAIASTKAGHIGINLVGKFPAAENVAPLLLGIKDRFSLKIRMRDGNVEAPELFLAPFRNANTPDVTLAPGQDLDLSYQWFKNGVLIPGATQDTLAVVADLADMGPDGLTPATYYVRVDDPVLGSAWSVQVPLVVSAQSAPPPLPRALLASPAAQEPTGGLIITQQPMSRSVVEATTVHLTVVAQDVATPGVLAPHKDFQWVIKAEHAAVSAGGQIWLDPGFSEPGMFAQPGTPVNPGGDVAIHLTPAGPVSLQVSQTQSFTASVTGTTFTEVTWTVDGVVNGSTTTGLLTGSGNTVTYTAPTMAGTHILVAVSSQDHTKQAAATIMVTLPPSPLVITVGPISPSGASITSGQTTPFTATVTGGVTNALVWSATGGSFSGNLWTPPAVTGTYTITATSVEDPTQFSTTTAVVTQQAPTISVSSVLPAHPSVLVNGTKAFTATVTGGTTNAIVWSATGGSFSGNVWTAPATPGTFTITATSAEDNTKSSSTTATATAVPVVITVSPVTPSGPSIVVGQTQTFNATASGGTTNAIVWSCNGGSFSGNVWTAPTAPGTYTITATSAEDGTKHTSTSAIVTAVPVVISISSVTPATPSVSAGQTQAFSVTVTGGTTNAVTWSCSGGSFSGSVWTAPATPGDYTITATSNEDNTKHSSTTATVPVVNAVVSVTLTPATIQPQVGTTTTLTSSITTTGTIDTSLTWKVDTIVGGNSTVGTLTGSGSTRTYTAPATAGNHTITVTSVADSSKTDSCAVTVSTPSSVTVAISSIGPDTMSTSGSATNTQSGTLLYANVTGSSSPVAWYVDGILNGNSTVGTISDPLTALFSLSNSTPVFYTAPQAAGTHVVRAVCGGSYDEITYTIAPLTMDPAPLIAGATNIKTTYGAVGNGVADDTTALSNAVNSANGTTTRVLYLPNGTYLLDGTINSGQGLLLKSNTIFILAAGATIKTKANIATPHYEVFTLNSVDNVSILGVNSGSGAPTATLNGSADTNSTVHADGTEDGTGIRVNGSTNVLIENIHATNFYCDGIYVRNSGGGAVSSDVVLSKVLCDYNYRMGLAIVDGTRMVVRQSSFNHNIGSYENGTGNPIINGTGVDVEGNVGSHISKLFFTGCDFSNNDNGVSAGISFGIGLPQPTTTTELIYVDHCTADNNHYGIIGENSTNCAVTFCSADNNTGVGIEVLYKAVNTLLEDCTVAGTGSGSDGAGIETGGSAGNQDSNTVINRCTSTGNAGYGFRAWGSLGLTLTNNDFRGNPTATRIEDSTTTTVSGNLP